MEQDNIKINELRKTISTLKWDLNIVRNKRIKSQKETKLRFYEQRLEELLKQYNEGSAS